MPKLKPLSISKATRYQNAALEYYLGLTNSPYLHYGYWDPLPASLDDLTPAHLRIAQQAYADRLLSFIPSGMKTVLDVGCGIGGNAAYLLSQGFSVEGLAPDAFQQERFLQQTHGQAPFHLSRFEDFETSKTYDLLLFSESSQYLSATDLAQRSAQFVQPDGYLIIADMFRKNAAYRQGIFSNCLAIAELEAALKQQGFQLIQVDDISTHVVPTIDLCLHYFQTFGLTTLRYIAQLVSIAVPLVHRLGRQAFRRWLEAPLNEAMQARTVFEQHLCYQIQLWHLPAPATPESNKIAS
ncbi:MAG: methyltransferase domain-containing protein [Leptolyngbyaceae cyanobacterium bins.349]|nr:methyltransferase domain-containing protein [Leptolyngbyaceae cyanobacterium bins.349]